MPNLIVGLAGVLLGASSSIITVWFQTSAQAKKDRLNVVKDLALEDHKSTMPSYLGELLIFLQLLYTFITTWRLPRN